MIKVGITPKFYYYYRIGDEHRGCMRICVCGHV